MLAVNQGISGTFHIFRGSAAHDFLGGVEVVSNDPCIIKLNRDRIEKGRFFLTKAGTGILVLNAENIGDAVARLAYKQVWSAVGRKLRRHHGFA